MDIVYIVNEGTGEVVTSYATPLKLDPVPINENFQRDANTAATNVKTNLDAWTSNTVIVVDAPGSMRTSDVCV
jgi:hypothetical protein